MAEPPDGGLLAIEVDTDDYAEIAGGDVPAQARTYQSEADFCAIKASYTAKIDGGNTHKDLIAAVPVLLNEADDTSRPNGVTKGHTRIKLTKKDAQLLGYAVGELYFDNDYAKCVELCQRAQICCDVDEKFAESLSRWMRRCNERLSQHCGLKSETSPEISSHYPTTETRQHCEV